VQIVDAIWESTSKVPGALPLAEWQREEPDRRIAELEADPGAGATLDEAFARIRRGP
jgi:putative addiction module component (TIGR02574 family)